MVSAWSLHLTTKNFVMSVFKCSKFWLTFDTKDNLVMFHFIVLALQITLKMMACLSQTPVSQSRLMGTCTHLPHPAKHQTSPGLPPTQMILPPTSPCTPLWLSALPFSSLCIRTGTLPSPHGDLRGKHTSMAWAPSLLYLA